MFIRALMVFLLLFSAFGALSEETAPADSNKAAPEKVERWVIDFFEAFNRYVRPGKLDHWMMQWSENAERYTPMGNAKGKENIRSLYEDLIARYENMDQEIIGIIVQGQQASVELMTKGTHKATGVEVDIPNVALLTFDTNGKVMKARVYFDANYVASQIPAEK